MPGMLIINALLFSIGWLACLLGGTSWWLVIPVAALLIHFQWVSSWTAEGKLVASVMLAGATLDSFLIQINVLGFPGEPTLVPLWLLLFWALLGTTINHSLAWSGRRWWLASATGAGTGALVYLAQAWLADLSMPMGRETTLLILAAIWAVVFPLIHGFAHLYRQQYQLRQ
ncbi:MAG TPA: DUF2878 domain-containing protein [Pseudomonas xinjiangensis]|uniref:DUF2878 domain-containing protein n=2 Tax=root TaxID=1 RepID=A0A7V1FRW9_9GAMM|nr:DUF2878 domain-containing protein [Halopseudomonas xinjiangensis]HEC49239.1 DUF2878 domain-containing protein [Halopseudomonas xinjiangensis]